MVALQSCVTKETVQTEGVSDGMELWVRCGVGVLVYMMRVTNEDSRDEINRCADDYYGSPITFLVPRCLNPLPNVQSPARGC